MFKGLGLKADSAFSKIYRRFRKPVFRFISFKVKDAEAAEELTQEVFLKVYRARDSYQAEYAFSSWLWAIVRNTITDHLRAFRTVTETESAAEIEPEQIPCPRQTAEAMVISRDQRRNLHQMMKALTRQQRRVLWLRAVHQLSYDEISARLGISIASVKNLCYRAKLSLAQGLVAAA